MLKIFDKQINLAMTDQLLPEISFVRKRGRINYENIFPLSLDIHLMIKPTREMRAIPSLLRDFEGF